MIGSKGRDFLPADVEEREDPSAMITVPMGEHDSRDLLDRDMHRCNITRDRL